MKITDRRAVPEPTGLPERIAFKTADDTSGQLLALDDAEGIVTAVVSVTGTEDEVSDIIVPGAYRETLAKRRPKVCWAHSWEHPIGRVLHIEELMPGDDRLPTATKDGSPWPREAGALVATMQFNMRSDEGKNAFEAVRFYSETGECEYSIGYQVPAGKSTRDGRGVRHIKSLDLYELSVVLFGAHTMTGTLSLKQALAEVVERKAGAPAPERRRRTAAEALAAIQTKAVATSAETVNDDTDESADESAAKSEAGVPTPSNHDGVMVALYPDPAAADKIAQQIAGPDTTVGREELHVTLAYLGKVSEVEMTADEVVRRVTDAIQGEAALTGTVGGIGMFPAEDAGVPVWTPVDVPGLGILRETIVDALGDVVRTDHGFTPHMTIGYDLGLIDPLEAVDVTFGEVRVVFGDQSRTIPLGGTAEEEKSLDGLSLSEVVRLTAIDSLTAETKAGGADRNRGGAEKLRRYWTVGAGGAKIAWNTPGDFTRCSKLLAEHMTPERAKGYCANRHKEMTGVWPGDKDNVGKKAAYDPALDADPEQVEYHSVEAKSYPRLPGSYEERQDALARAVTDALRGDRTSGEDDEPRYEWDHVSVDATYPDRVFATRMRWSDDARQTFEVGYRFDGETVEVLDLVEVELQVVAVDVDGNEDDSVPIGDVLPLAEQVMAVTHAFKSAQGASMQTKAGRVLSGANERRLRLAVENLVNVLAAAGVRIHLAEDTDTDTDDDGDGERQTATPVDPSIDLETTSPSASVKALADGSFVVDAKSLEAMLASFADV